jgi:hypothetical protein
MMRRASAAVWRIAAILLVIAASLFVAVTPASAGQNPPNNPAKGVQSVAGSTLTLGPVGPPTSAQRAAIAARSGSQVAAFSSACRWWHNEDYVEVPPFGPTIWKLHNDGVWCWDGYHIYSLITDKPPALYVAPPGFALSGPDAQGNPWVNGMWRSHSWASIVYPPFGSYYAPNVCTELHPDGGAVRC